MLRMVTGLTMTGIARAFLVQETAMGERITHANAKIKAACIPYRAGSPSARLRRTGRCLPCLQRGLPGTGPDTDPVLHGLTAEAIRLTHLIRALMPTPTVNWPGCWR